VIQQSEGLGKGSKELMNVWKANAVDRRNQKKERRKEKMRIVTSPRPRGKVRGGSREWRGGHRSVIELERKTAKRGKRSRESDENR